MTKQGQCKIKEEYLNSASETWGHGKSHGIWKAQKSTNPVTVDKYIDTEQIIFLI